MRSLFRLFGLLFLLVLPAHAGHSPPKIIWRVYVQTTGEGLSGNESRQITVPPDNETIMIRTLPEVSEADLVAVRIDTSGYAHFLLNHRGQVNLDAVTAQNQGRILVVTINGYIIYAPIIDEEISNGDLVIPHPIPAPIVALLQDMAKKNLVEAQKQ